MQFSDFNDQKEKWITFIESEYYPDYIEQAKKDYTAFLQSFDELIKRAKDSRELLSLIMLENQPSRIQLLRIFKRYVSPDTSVEMLKVKRKSQKIIQEYGSKFRGLEEVKMRYKVDDNVLVCLLREYEDRGSKGYKVCDIFFEWFTKKFGSQGFSIQGPRGAGRDINLQKIFSNYPRPRPTDFIIYYLNNPIVVGFIRYDSDRGGAQEDDRTGGYRDVVTEVLNYSKAQKRGINILFINDGPGLTLGSMWDDYASLEKIAQDHVLVATLKMLDSRITKDWLQK
jgi:hypothetical protein